MFTGIIQGIADIISIKKKINYNTYEILLPKNISKNLKIGISVAVNGCCLTITKIKKNIIYFDVIKETLNITNFKNLKIGDKVNIERAVKLQDEIGGHIMSGHIMTTAQINNIINSKNKYEIAFSLKNKKFMKFILYKGFIGIDGISLTVSKIHKDSFFINFIPQTLYSTNIILKKYQDYVNVEFDYRIQVIVESLKKIIKNNF